MKIFLSQSPFSVFPLDKRAGSLTEVWRWWHLWYLSCQASTDTSAARACHNRSIFSFEKVLTTAVLKQRLVCCTSLLSYMLLLCCILRNPQQQWTRRLLCIWKTPITLLPHFFWDTLSLMRTTLYKHPASLCLPLLGVLSLIRPCSSWDITMHRKFAVCQSTSWLDSFFEENQTFIALEDKKDHSDFQPNTDCKWPLVLRYF